MTVYNYFIKIALKHKSIILTYVLVFFTISILNSSTSQNTEDYFMETKLRIGIVDESNSELSNSLKDYLGEKNNIVDINNDEDYIKEQIFLEKINAVLVIPSDFKQNVIDKKNTVEVYKDARKVHSLQVQNQINKFLTFANATYEDGKFNLNDVNIALAENVSVDLVNDNTNTTNKSVDMWFQRYYNFTGYVIVAVYIVVIGFVMTDFSNENIQSRRKVSSIKLIKFNKEIYLGQLTVATIISLIFILGSVVLKGKYIGEINFIKYIVNISVFSSSILCLTFLVNSFVSNKHTISALSTIISLGTAFISGVMVPQQLLSESVLKIAKFFPTYYFVKINEMSISSLLDIKYELFMQVLFGVVFLLVGLYCSKSRQSI